MSARARTDRMDALMRTRKAKERTTRPGRGEGRAEGQRHVWGRDGGRGLGRGQGRGRGRGRGQERGSGVGGKDEEGEPMEINISTRVAAGSWKEWCAKSRKLLGWQIRRVAPHGGPAGGRVDLWAGPWCFVFAASVCKPAHKVTVGESVCCCRERSRTPRRDRDY